MPRVAAAAGETGNRQPATGNRQRATGVAQASDPHCRLPVAGCRLLPRDQGPRPSSSTHMYLSKHSISVAAGNIAHALRDRDPVLLSLAVTWNRLLVVALLGAAMLLFRTSRNYCPEIQDARGDVELSDLDDGAPAIAPSAGPGL